MRRRNYQKKPRYEIAFGKRIIMIDGYKRMKFESGSNGFATWRTQRCQPQGRDAECLTNPLEHATKKNVSYTLNRKPRHDDTPARSLIYHVDLDDAIGSLLLALVKNIVPSRSVVFFVFSWLSCGLKKTRVGRS
ncbi:hypothetical protein VNO80_02433 [Phaseolus coccineus]|uniref:Uncharacterized protein n=1 Tax=Phaseolus coccineus TaxID=3886 RepID=A0AAN9RRI2_PHACN